MATRPRPRHHDVVNRGASRGVSGFWQTTIKLVQPVASFQNVALIVSSTVANLNPQHLDLQPET